MKKISPIFNITVFIILIALFLLTDCSTRISTSLLSTLPKSQSKELLKEFETSTNNKILMIAIKGFDEHALTKMNNIKARLLKVEDIEPINKIDNEVFLAHQKKYQFFNMPFDEKRFQLLDVEKELKKLYNDLTNAFIPPVIDKNDPFNLVKKDEFLNIKLKNGQTIIEDYGYIEYFQINGSSLNDYRSIYQNIEEITHNIHNIRVFSPIFFYVQNSNAIKEDVNTIIFLALFILMSLYLIILKNIKLFVHTVITLGSSSLLAAMIITSVYVEVSVFVIVFGVSISSIAIDYMFHHYMHGYYSQKNKINKEVFYGFLTTLIAFFTLSFISFPLIKQICWFASISLLFSYIQFSFLYPKMNFIQKRAVDFKLPTFYMNPFIIFLFSLLCIVFFSTQVHLDTNIKNLDYDNKVLKEEEAFFSKINKKETFLPILIEANDINALIFNAKKIKKYSPSSYVPFSKLVHNTDINASLVEQLSHLNKEILLYSDDIGFRKGFFSEAYRSKKLNVPTYTMKMLKEFGLEVFKYKESYYTYFFINKNDYKHISKFSFVKLLSMKELFENELKSILDEFIFLGILIFVFICSVLLVIAQKRIIYSANFLLFPLAIILSISTFTVFNILHIFMSLIVFAISIDYAFYTSKEVTINTKKAIIYSLLSTFSGFGVLVFSSIPALYSIGTVAVVGILSIFLLLIFSKRFKSEN